MNGKKRIFLFITGFSIILLTGTSPTTFAQQAVAETSTDAKDAGYGIEVSGYVKTGDTINPLDSSTFITEVSHPTEKSHLTEIQKSIKILCKILDHELTGTLKDGYSSKSIFSEGCRGYWIPNTGILISLNVDFSVHQEKAVEKEKTKKIDENDLWERFDSEVSGKTNTYKAVDVIYKTNVAKQSGFNKKKVDSLKETIVEVLAQYGNRCKNTLGLEQNGKMIVLVNGKGGRFGHTILVTSGKDKFDDYSTMYMDMEMNPNDDPSNVDGRVQRLRTNLSKNTRHFEEILALQEKQQQLAKRKLDRLLKQFKSGVASQDQIDEAKKELTQKQIEREKAKAQLEDQRAALEDQMRQLEDSQKLMKQAQHQYQETIKQYPDNPVFKQVAPPGVAATPKYYSYTRGKNLIDPFGRETNGGTTMILQIPFNRLPKEGGSKQAIEDHVRIITY